MSRQTFAWGRSSYKLRQQDGWLEFFCVVGLLIAALILFTINLGNLALRDWDEATVAQVAKEIWQAPSGSLKWLFPTFWGEPYFNKPPLVHDLIALFYHIGGVNEWTARFSGAFLTACSVPLLYLLGREVFPSRFPSFCAALIYLTLLPVVRHGRLAMLDGAVLCFEILMIGCMLRSRRDLRWSIGIGLGFSLLCLTKGIIGCLIAVLVLAFLAWDTPRLLTSAYFWFGWGLGSIPALAWYLAQWTHYEKEFINALFDQQINRLGETLDHHRHPVWYYLLEIVKYSFPWLLFAVAGLQLAWQDRHYSWAKLVLVWSGVYFGVVSLMATKLPWYILPIYPALALAGGATLADLRDWPKERPYPRFWRVLLTIVAIAAGVICLCLCFNLTFGLVPSPHFSLTLLAASLAMTLGVSARLMKQHSLQFMVVLFWGMYVSLLLFVNSPYWVWELGEAYPVKPVAAMIKQHSIPRSQTIYTLFDYERPSLNFYSDHRIIPRTSEELQEHWHNSPQPYLLVPRQVLSDWSKLEGVKVLGEASPDWILITKENVNP